MVGKNTMVDMQEYRSLANQKAECEIALPRVCSGAQTDNGSQGMVMPPRTVTALIVALTTCQQMLAPTGLPNRH